MLAGILPEVPAAIPLVAHEALGPTFGATTPHPPDRSLRPQVGEDYGFVPLAWRQDQGQARAMPFRAAVDCGTQAAPAAP